MIKYVINIVKDEWLINRKEECVNYRENIGSEYLFCLIIASRINCRVYGYTAGYKGNITW